VESWQIRTLLVKSMAKGFALGICANPSHFNILERLSFYVSNFNNYLKTNTRVVAGCIECAEISF